MLKRLLPLFILLVPAVGFSQMLGNDSVTLAPSISTDTGQVSQDDAYLQDIPTVSLTDTDVSEDASQNVSSTLGASRDPFFSAASFTFSFARFRIRGYQNTHFNTYMNGVSTNDLNTGTTPWGQWGGLNTMFYNRETSLGLQPNTFSYGGVGGSFGLDSRASKQRKQLQVSYAVTNRNYRHRLMASYSTGVMKKGWAVSLAFTKRWAEEGYVKGTFYDGYSYFLGVEKKFGTKHSLALTALGSPTRSGRSTAAIQEAYDLAGTNYYNPSWGYQDGKKRNANVSNTFQPLFILTHEFKINNKQNLLSAASFSFGKRAVTAIDWNNAADPRPDYYRYLPSYQEDPTQAALVADALRKNVNLMQINWDGLYQANAMSNDSVLDANGIVGNTVSGKRARYIVENRVQDEKKFNLNSTYNNTLTDHISITASIAYKFQQTENYKTVDDLMGGDFYVDINQFAERDFRDSAGFAQNDLNRPNRILNKGDKFGWDYLTTVHQASAWAQGVFKYNHVDFFISGQLSSTAYWRTGKTKFGLFPNDSEGRSELKNFINGGLKAGATYKINGRSYVFANAAFETRAPYIRNAFVSARTRNEYATDLKSEKIYSGELGYILSTPTVKLKASLYFSQFNDQTQNFVFFHDDYRTFVTYTLTGMNVRHWGGEIGAEVKLYKGFSANVAGSFGRYTFVNRPTATITQDNSASVRSVETIYAKNFNVGGTPQLATSFGLNYRDPKFWFANVRFNYYDWMWLGFNPARRTEAATGLVEPGTEKYNKIINQERLKGQFTMDISAGYSWLLNNNFKNLKKRYFLVFNVGIANVTNNTKFVTGGAEQLRFDFNEGNADKFPSKYFYAYGATYFINLTFRMQ